MCTRSALGYGLWQLPAAPRRSRAARRKDVQKKWHVCSGWPGSGGNAGPPAGAVRPRPGRPARNLRPGAPAGPRGRAPARRESPRGFFGDSSRLPDSDISRRARAPARYRRPPVLKVGGNLSATAKLVAARAGALVGTNCKHFYSFSSSVSFITDDETRAGAPPFPGMAEGSPRRPAGNRAVPSSGSAEGRRGGGGEGRRGSGEEGTRGGGEEG